MTSTREIGVGSITDKDMQESFMSEGDIKIG